MGEELKLFRTWSSLFGVRAVHALEIKGLEFETVLEDLQNKSDALLEYNPVYKKVPVLVYNGKPICESLVIIEYIDETWKHPGPLLPQDPYDRAMARFWAKFGDDKLMPSIWKVFISQGKSEVEEAMVEAKENLKLVQEQLEGKKFFGGETIGYLDIAFGWMGNVMSILEEVADVKIEDMETLPLLSVWITVFAQDLTIKELWPPRDQLVERYKIKRETQIKKIPG